MASPFPWKDNIFNKKTSHDIQIFVTITKHNFVFMYILSIFQRPNHLRFARLLQPGHTSDGAVIHYIILTSLLTRH